MRKIKILVSVLISVALILSLFVPAMAATEYKIKIENPVTGQVYKVYKIFDLYYSGNAGVYTATQGIKDILATSTDAELKAIITDETHYDGKYLVKAFNESVAKKLAAFLQEEAEDGGSLGAYIVGGELADPNVEMVVSEPGYYFVTSSMGSLCSLNSTTPTAVIREKNTEVQVDKNIIPDEDNSKRVDENTAQIGDTVYFETIVTIPVGAVNVRLYDKMEPGFTFNEGSLVATVGYDPGFKWYSTSNKKDPDSTFEIDFDQVFLKGLTKETKVTVTYSAILNENAEIYESGKTNDNSTWVVYGAKNNIETEVKTTKTKTYDFDLFKYTGSKVALAGAEFKLYSDKDCTQEVSLYKVNETSYRVAKSGETGSIITSISTGDGIINIKGLDGDKTYYLKETKAPDGYNMVTTPFSISEETGASIAFGGKLEVQNNAGALLPETGGTGTKVLFAVGGVLVVVAFVLFTSKRRMSAEG